MSTRSSQAQLHRILSREEEAISKHDCATIRPCTAVDPICFEHLGALFPQGSRKGSLSAYPDGIEIGDNVAAVQPYGVVPGAQQECHLQLSLNGGLRCSERFEPTPTPELTPDRSCISYEGFEELRRQYSGEHWRGHGCTRRQHSQGSTTTQTHESSLSTFSGYSDNDESSMFVLPLTYKLHQAASAFSESRTPSRCSAVTDEDETYPEGAGPSPPHPYSEWDPYEKRYFDDSEKVDGTDGRVIPGARRSSADGKFSFRNKF